MFKYYNAMVVFEEIPDEITLAINITNCPCKCPGCHSKFLWNDIGTELTTEELDKLIEKNDGITTVCFMGGDANPDKICELAEYIRKNKNLKIGWYSGRDEYYKNINFNWFDYIKLGHYDEKFGPLNKKTTNQRLFKLKHDKVQTKINDEESMETNRIMFEDITNLFWKKGD
jgi:anaerobic ribonucleoside-triphosphate reductase activating protein